MPSTPVTPLPEPAAAALARLTAAPEALLIIVDNQGRIQDVRKVDPVFLTANLVAAAQTQPNLRQGEPPCPSDAGPYPWLSD
jgi:hypothetical protein